jgi:cytochrome c oxidase subunit 2
MNDTDLQLFPEAASTVAPAIDQLFWFLTILTIVLSTLIAALIVYFSIKYRRASTADRTPYTPSMMLEMTWIVGPIPILLGIFFWSADLFFELRRPPADSMQVTVVAKQWMWKFQHPTGRREIDVLHVPVNRPVRTMMISQDVIHSFYVPAFRIKQDVLPGRYTTAWFQADKIGEYHLFCAEYCGTNHSRMIGKVIVMSEADYGAWLAGRDDGPVSAPASEPIFARLRCASCHEPTESGPARGPSLAGLFGREVRLADGSTVQADEGYIRESIMRPQAKLVAGYPPIMPTFEGQLSEEDVLDLIQHIKSLPASQENKPATGADASRPKSPEERPEKRP